MTEAAAEKKITTEKRGHLLLIGLNRPKKMNAFDVEMLNQLGEAFVELEKNDDLRVGVLFAHGEHFTSGLDLANVGPAVAAGQGLGNAAIDPLGIHGPLRSKPTVCAVHGRCLTVGIELSLAQDITIASDDTKFAQIEIKRGIFPFGGATIRWVQRSGWGNAMRYLLTGDELGAAEAFRIGLVQEVVPRTEVLTRAIQIAETIAAQAPLGVRATIESARKALIEAEAARALLPIVQKLMASDDAREGLMSFIERRAGNFTGK